MSGATLRTRRGMRGGLRGPTEDAARLGLIQEELIAVQPIAAAALAEGAISEEQYLAYLARADELDEILTRASGPSAGAAIESAGIRATALRAEVTAARGSGLTAHRNRIWLMVGVAALLAILMVAGLAAWSYRSPKS